ncbi:GTP-binding protein [Mycoplasmopsis felis]|nr:GTP-binding protein [Mycoplasmopsis felis]MCU9933969.1 GTP-binding protein [Mycoplasmopsis felis]
MNTSHIEYQTEKRHYAHVDCPGHADYVKKRDYRGSSNGWCYLSCCCNRWINASNTWTHSFI